MVQASVIRGEITQNPEWNRLVSQADGWVRQALNSWQEGKNIEWSVRKTADGKPLFDFSIRSKTNRVMGEFTSSEIADPREMSWKVVRLWGDLIDQNMLDTFDNIHAILTDWRAEERLASVGYGGSFTWLSCRKFRVGVGGVAGG